MNRIIRTLHILMPMQDQATSNTWFPIANLPKGKTVWDEITVEADFVSA